MIRFWDFMAHRCPAAAEGRTRRDDEAKLASLHFVEAIALEVSKGQPTVVSRLWDSPRSTPMVRVHPGSLHLSIAARRICTGDLSRLRLQERMGTTDGRWSVGVFVYEEPGVVLQRHVHQGQPAWRDFRVISQGIAISCTE